MQQVRQMPLDEVVILDVDESTLESPHVEDLASLPPDITSNLKQVLKKHSSAYGDTVTRAFMLAQVSMIGGYRSALKLRMVRVNVCLLPMICLASVLQAAHTSLSRSICWVNHRGFNGIHIFPVKRLLKRL